MKDVTPWSISRRMRLCIFGRDYKLHHSQCTILEGTQGQRHITVNINSDYLVLSIVTTHTSIFPNLVVIKFAGKSVKTDILSQYPISYHTFSLTFICPSTQSIGVFCSWFPATENQETACRGWVAPLTRGLRKHWDVSLSVSAPSPPSTTCWLWLSLFCFFIEKQLFF